MIWVDGENNDLYKDILYFALRYWVIGVAFVSAYTVLYLHGEFTKTKVYELRIAGFVLSTLQKILTFFFK